MNSKNTTAKKAEEEDVFEQMKKKNASQAGAGQRSYQFN